MTAQAKTEQAFRGCTTIATVMFVMGVILVLLLGSISRGDYMPSDFAWLPGALGWFATALTGGGMIYFVLLGLHIKTHGLPEVRDTRTPAQKEKASDLESKIFAVLFIAMMMGSATGTLWLIDKKEAEDAAAPTVTTTTDID